MIKATIYPTGNGGFFVSGTQNDRRSVEIEVTDPERIALCQQFEAWIDGVPNPALADLAERVEQAEQAAEQAQAEAAASAEQLREVLSIFPEWQPGQWLQPKEYRHYENTIYKYTGTEYYKTAATETPDQSKLYVKASPETYDVKPIREHVEGAVYDAGDRLMWKDGKVYVSTQDGNRYTPDIATAPWELVK